MDDSQSLDILVAEEVYLKLSYKSQLLESRVVLPDVFGLVLSDQNQNYYVFLFQDNLFKHQTTNFHYGNRTSTSHYFKQVFNNQCPLASRF